MSDKTIIVEAHCLKCGKVFLTSTKFQRLCNNCKKLNYGKASGTRNHRKTWTAKGSSYQ